MARAKTSKANARLIAAAPDMLAVLKDCLNGMDVDCHVAVTGDRIDGLLLTREFVSRIVATIAKAEGK